MITATPFSVAPESVPPLEAILVSHGLHRAKLDLMGHGAALWISKTSAYLVEVEVMNSDHVVPYSIVISRRDALDADSPGEVMARCEIDGNFDFHAAHFQGGMPAEEVDFRRYLCMALDDIDCEPELTSEFDVDQDQFDLLSEEDEAA